jgi:DNA topoisomerase IA
MMSGSLVATVKPAHSSNVNIMTTKSPPSFCGVITTAEVDKLVKYSNLLGTDQYVDLKSICDKAAILTIESHLSARGHLCGCTKPTDYERWLDWDHRKFADFMVILFGEDQTRVNKSTDLLTTVIKFNFGLNDNSCLGGIRNTHSEQRVLFELSQHIENDFNPEHKTESRKMELVRLIHRNLKPNSIIMLAMNKDKPPATTPKEFF